LISEGADHELLNDKGRTAFSFLLRQNYFGEPFDGHAAKAEVEKAVRDYKTLRACVPILK